jgi:hypothetical protein
MNTELSSAVPSVPKKGEVDQRPDAGWFEKFKGLLGRRVDGGSLAWFRIFVGMVMALEAFTLLRPSASTAGKVPLEVYYTGPNISFNLPYPGFEWLPILSTTGMHLMVGVLAAGAISLAAGFLYRFAAVAVFLAWGYFYALEATRTYWMSYYYLELLVAFLLIWMPAAERYSIDAWWKKRKGAESGSIPFWPVFLLRAQLVITYFYAGVAKLNPDWLLDAQPVKYYLSQPNVAASLKHFIGSSAVTWAQSSQLAYVISWAGAAFDLSVGFLLCWRRTRWVGFCMLLFFHLTNHFLLFNDIEWFPLVGITTATIFFAPDWPSKAWRCMTRDRKRVKNGAGLQAAVSYPVARWTAPLLCLWVAGQVFIPLRGFFIPGDARMTFEGLSFSWRLKADVYRTTPAEIYIEDDGVVAKEGIDWSNWKGERVIYDPVDTRSIAWDKLPEIVVTFEPVVGERIFYNRYSSEAKAHGDAEIKDRVLAIWRDNFGETPDGIYPTVSVAQVVQAYSAALKNHEPRLGGGVGLETLLRERSNPQIMKLLRRMHPFALDEGEARQLYLIDAAGRFITNADLPKLSRNDWKAGSAMLPLWWKGGDLGNAVYLVISDTWSQMGELFPKSFIVAQNGGLKIAWNYRKELPTSKVMHISAQPFLLQKYAEIVAREWKQETGRIPEVHAVTSVSLNFRPPQAVVDPEADLAEVRVSHVSHNPWIKDLQVARIPQ